MLLDDKNWYFFNDYNEYEPVKSHNMKVRTYSIRREYECFLLASAEEMNKLRYEDEVGGFSVISSYKTPYPVFCASMNSSNIQHILDKYELQGIWIQKPSTDLYYS